MYGYTYIYDWVQFWCEYHQMMSSKRLVTSDNRIEVSSTLYIIFADDTTYVLSGESQVKLQEKLNMYRAAWSNRLICNQRSCLIQNQNWITLIWHSRNYHPIPNNQISQTVLHIKFLQINVDSSLNRKQHISELPSKLLSLASFAFHE